MSVLNTLMACVLLWLVFVLGYSFSKQHFYLPFVDDAAKTLTEFCHPERK